MRCQTLAAVLCLLAAGSRGADQAANQASSAGDGEVKRRAAAVLPQEAKTSAEDAIAEDGGAEESLPGPPKLGKKQNCSALTPTKARSRFLVSVGEFKEMKLKKAEEEAAAKKKKAEDEAAAEQQENGDPGAVAQSDLDLQIGQADGSTNGNDQSDGTAMMVSHEGEVD